MDSKKDLMRRVYVMMALLCLFGTVIVGQIVRLQLVEGKKWKSKADSLSMAVKNIDAVRGNIFASDGSLLATSIPIYEVRMDVYAASSSPKIFTEQAVDSLSWALADLFKDKTKADYKRMFYDARKRRDRYLLIARNVSYMELKVLRTFPVFRLGKFKGGLVVLPSTRRERPFRMLAARTIGFARAGIRPVGLEGAFDTLLRGVSGKRLVQRISGGAEIPVSDDNEIEPKDGSDIITTIDINIQDVAENALLTQLTQHNADHGCVVLMEVRTGEIKAIANLSKNKDGSYYENFNYAVGEATEPGSTFKLASLIAAMDDGLVALNDSVDTRNGECRYYDRVMKDSHEGGYGKITVKHAFEVSSNVGISGVIYRSYAKKPKAFVDKLYAMGLNTPLGLQFPGEAPPRIKHPKDKDWYGTTLPWMSIGYEVKLTPLQILSFYNAVANDGKMIKPLFVKEIRNHGKLVGHFTPAVLQESICSPATAKKAKEMMEGVVLNGTAKNLKGAVYRIAGKTGTAQIANAQTSYKDKSYQASFVGYFPADNPRYSCIVVVYSPSNEVYYGNLVAGPVFKEIADKIYANRLDMHSPYVLPNGVPVLQTTSSESPEESKKIFSRVPDLKGMGLRDAVYLLENNGLRVKVTGRGKVAIQNPPPGQPLVRGSEIAIELN